ncbi:hypothetical protein [Halovivax gelatinilyticus]|uniref:hypothetical protein n=1 Tax=Halovivax gelatinilyticus TaxID=2961597 RepID=UPI0020CA6F47|nr:hypothetical protein [Halovivax gelatinilyticus]
MRVAHISQLEAFGTRSLAIHGVMVLAFVNAVLAGLLIGGELGVVSFVALLSFTAGLWVSHSIHSLGNALGEDEYAGVLNELVRTADDTDRGLTVGRFGRLLSLIALVTAITLLTAGQVLAGPILSVVIVAAGAIALVTAIVGYFIAIGDSYDRSQERTIAEIERRHSAGDDRASDR